MFQKKYIDWLKRTSENDGGLKSSTLREKRMTMTRRKNRD